MVVSRLLGGDFVGGEMTVNRAPSVPSRALNFPPLFRMPTAQTFFKERSGDGNLRPATLTHPNYAWLLLFWNVPTKIRTVFQGISRPDLWSQKRKRTYSRKKSRKVQYCKIPIWRKLKNRYFYSLERLVFFIEHYQSLFLGLFCPKRNNLKVSNLWPNSLV